MQYFINGLLYGICGFGALLSFSVCCVLLAMTLHAITWLFEEKNEEDFDHDEDR